MFSDSNTYNPDLSNLGIFTDYSLFSFIIPLLLLLGLITVKRKLLGNIILGFVLFTILLTKTKVKQTLEYILMDHATIIQVITLLSFLLIVYSMVLVDIEKKEKLFIEYTILILVAMFGIFISMETTDLLTIFVALEMQAFSFYTLVSLKKGNLFATEGGLKYFLIGALASACIIFATALIFQNTGFNDIALIADLLPIKDNMSLYKIGALLLIIGLLFKIGAVPFHLWLPDAYQGATFYTLIFIAIFPKIAIIFLLFTLNNVLQQDNVIFMACLLSGIVGSVQAASQTKVKRFLAYGIIFNNCYFLAILLIAGKQAFLGLLESMGLYLIVSLLIFLTINTFVNASTGLRFKSLRDLISLRKSALFAAFTLSIAFFSAAGIPPFMGFYQKYLGLYVLIEKLQTFIAVFLILATILPVYYYLRTTKIMFFLSNSTHMLLVNARGTTIPQIISWLLGITIAFLFI